MGGMQMRIILLMLLVMSAAFAADSSLQECIDRLMLAPDSDKDYAEARCMEMHGLMLNPDTEEPGENLMQDCIESLVAANPGTDRIRAEARCRQMLTMHAGASEPAQTMEECVHRIMAVTPETDMDRAEERCRQMLSNALPREIPRPSDACVSLLASRIPDAEAACARIYSHREDCAQMLEEYGIENAQALCDSLVARAEDALSEQLRERVAGQLEQWRQERLDHIAGRAEYSFLSSLNSEQVKKFMHLPRAEQQRILTERSSGLLNRYELSEIREGDLSSIRTIAEERLKQAQDRMAQARERLQLAEANFTAIKEHWNSVRDMARACRDRDSDQCRELEQQAVERARHFLINRATAAIQQLETLRARVEASEAIEQETADELIAVIDERIAEIQAIIDDAEDAEKREDIQDAARRLAALWTAARLHAGAMGAHLMNSHVGLALLKSAEFEQQIDCALSKMEENGIDTENLQAKLEEYSAMVAQAKDDWDNAKALYIEIRILMLARSLPDSSMIDEMKALVRSSHEKIKQAHLLLREMFSEIRASRTDISDCMRQPAFIARDACSTAFEECTDACGSIECEQPCPEEMQSCLRACRDARQECLSG